MEESGKYSRRAFARLTLKAGIAGLSAISLPELLYADNTIKLTILHTNDTHSRIDPFPAGDPKFAGRGGVSRRAALIEAIRKQEQHVLLLDSGDIFQGTPYFNYFGGEVEFKSMSAMAYDAATLGNHDFDNGINGLVKQLPHASFPFLNSNYDLGKTALSDHVKPYKVFTKGPVRIGIFGLGIQLEGLVPEENCKGVLYRDPVKAANETAKHLRNKEGCDLVICLSHLGYKYDDKNRPSDEMLALQTHNVDLILGGHTHTFLERAVEYKNPANKKVLVAQTGWGGVNLGRVDYYFLLKNKKLFHSSSTIKISEKSS
jgi:5'-nucleotidase